MKKYIWLFLAILATPLHAQTAQQFVHLGDFKTTGGGVIRDCKIGYRTIGKMNQNKNNVVLWPSWFTGTSETVSKAVLSLTDTTGLCFLVIDSFGNGVSSSPSNTPNFPVITIRDMVNAEHLMLTEKMKINHLYGVMGISMGGMQTFEWINTYPGFMDVAIPIVGTPKESFYDNLVWETCVKLITEARLDHRDMNVAMQSVTNILNMNMYTPEYWNRTHSPDSLAAFLAQEYKQKKNAEDHLSQLQAMITHDIYKDATSPIKDKIKCSMLVVVARQDHLVNPTSSMEFAKTNNVRLVVNESYFGHMGTVFAAEEFRKEIAPFLKLKH